MPLGLLREHGSLMQRRGAFLVRAAGRVHERAAQGDERRSEKLAVAGPARGGDRPTLALQAGLDGPGGERGLAGLELRQDGRTRRNTGRGRDLRGDVRHPQRGRGRDPELPPEHLGARRDVTRRGRGVPARAQAADQQHVRVLLERVEADECGRVTHRFGALAPCEQCERGLVEDGAGRPRDMAALAFEPHLEARAGAEREPVEQLMAETGKRDGLRPRSPAEDVEVDERARPKRQADGIAAELRVSAQLGAQDRERPAERAQRIVGLGAQQPGQSLS